MHLSIRLLFTLCFFTLLCKANQPEQLKHLFAKSEAKTTKINYYYFSTQQAKKSFIYSIDLGNYGTYELLLHANDLFAPDFKTVLQKKHSLPLTFSGKIANQTKSQVALTVNQDFLSGYVFNGETTIYFEPLNHFISQAKANELIIYNEQDVLNEKFYCAHDLNDPNDHQPMSFKIEEQRQAAKRAVCGDYVVELVLVADYGMHQKYGSSTAVRNQITSIVNAARQNYDDEFNNPITFQIVDEYIATSADDDLWDVNETNARSLLDEFALSDFTDKVYDLASLWVTREIWETRNGNRRILAGLAYDGGLCKDEQKYNLISVKGSTEEYLITVFSHEVGHNFNAIHDPNGTDFIMSEGELSNTWSAASLNRINSFYPSTNCLCSSEFVDLKIQSFCLQFGVGDNISKAPTIENIGNIASPSTKVGLFLSEDNNITTNDYLVRSVSFDVLQPGDSRNASVLINFDDVDLPCGDYFYGVIADAENSITEGDETNNTGCRGTHTIECVEPDIDLIVESCANITISGNNINTGNIILKNEGSTAAAASQMGYYLSSNTIIDINDYLIAASNFPELQAGASFGRTIGRNISEVNPPVPAGTYYVGFLADRKKVLNESNENNNSCYDANPRFTVTYDCKVANSHNYNPNATYNDEDACETCTDGIKNGDEIEKDCGGSCTPCTEEADLIIENCNSVSITGNTINTGSFTVKNIGGQTATSSLLGIYLSSNTTIDNNDYLFIQSNYAEVTAGSSINRILARNISDVQPSIPAGTYYVGFLADRRNVLTEAIETNNSCYDTNIRFTVSYGCKDANAHNYEPNATYKDDALCQTCNDGIKNGNEEDIDCNGSCPLSCSGGNPLDCKQTDKAALIALYNSTDGANWTKPWNLSEPMENWDGITLNADGCVERIYFFNNNLNGSLPEEIGQISELKSLQLRYNGISGEIPNSIGQLKNLEILNFSTNKITGNIPTSIGELSNLKYLGLGSNKLIGGIPSALGNLSKLETLSLYANQLSSTIPAKLGNLSSLKDLSLYSNGLTGSIPLQLGNLSKLQKLKLAANQLKGSIPYTFGKLNNLKELKLYSNQLENYIPWQLGNLSNLEELSIQSNQLSGPIPLQFGKLSNLEMLEFSNNKLTGTLPAELGDLNNLKILSAGRNDLSGCFHENLKNLCDARVDVNYRTNYQIEWDNFCATTNDGICQPAACENNDVNSLLNLSFDFTLEGKDGERPINYQGLSYDERAYQNTALNIQGNYFDEEMELSYPAANNINLNQGTIEAWVMHFWDGDSYSQHTLVQYGAWGGLLFFKDGANNFRLLLNRWSPAGFPEIGVGTSTQFWESGEWRHVAATWGNGEIILYIDGEIADRNTYTQPIATVEDAYFNIGSEAGNATWGGLIDQFRISNKVRTKSEINAFRFACTSDRVKPSTSVNLSNYPNPFTGETTIKYELPVEKPITLFVTDMMGKKVTTLLNNELKPKGDHSINFDSSNYPPGMYYYTLQAGDFVETQKMILIE